jgi:peptidase MA superfamily protein
MRYLHRFAFLTLVLFGGTLHSRAGEWQVLDHPPVRIYYQQGNGTEAQLLAGEAAAVLKQVESDLGLEVEAPLDIRILPARETPGVGSDDGAPHWAVGYVKSGSREVVLRGSWVRTYPFGDLLSLFAHETTHVLLDSVPRAESLPRWFQEGVAVMESRHWSFRDAFALGTTVLVGRPTPLAELTRSFPSDDSAARAAYAESFHFVSFLEREHGPGAVRRILEGMKQGAEFPEAFRRALGRDLPSVEAVWRSRVNFAYRWIPALTSTGFLWMGITLLVLLGRIARLRRDRALLDSWKQQGLD